MVPNRAYFFVSVTVLVVVLVGYFLAPIVGLEPYVIAFAGSGVLVIAGAATGRVGIRTAGELSWDLLPFVVGLFVAVQGLENLGIVGVASRWLEHMKPGSTENLLAALVGADVAPMITPFGSLATMLVLALARREGEDVCPREFVTLGLWSAPLIVGDRDCPGPRQHANARYWCRSAEARSIPSAVDWDYDRNRFA